MPSSAWLPATTYSILGLLSYYDRELSGFEVKKWADASLRFFYWSPAMSQVYRELERLESSGFVASRVVAGEGTRSKRVYGITEAGRTELTRWVEQAPVEPTLIRDSVVLRVWLGNLADPDRLRALLEEQRTRLREALAEVRHLGEMSAGRPRYTYPHLVARWGELQYQADLAGIDLLLAGIDEAEADGPDGPGRCERGGPGQREPD